MSYDALVGSSLLGVHITQLGVQTIGLTGVPDWGWAGRVWLPVYSVV